MADVIEPEMGLIVEEMANSVRGANGKKTSLSLLDLANNVLGGK